MKSASVSEARNGFSELLRQTRRGETILITDRGKPVAKLEPFRQAALPDDAALLLVRRGIASPPRAPLDLDAFLNAPRPRLRAGVRASEVLIRERRESR